MRNCPIQELCIDYSSGGNEPPNHDVRDKVPCFHFISMSCPALLEILPKVGESISCNIEEVKEKKRRLA